MNNRMTKERFIQEYVIRDLLEMSRDEGIKEPLHNKVKFLVGQAENAWGDLTEVGYGDEEHPMLEGFKKAVDETKEFYDITDFVDDGLHQGMSVEFWEETLGAWHTKAWMKPFVNKWGEAGYEITVHLDREDAAAAYLSAIAFRDKDPEGYAEDGGAPAVDGNIDPYAECPYCNNKDYLSTHRCNGE